MSTPIGLHRTVDADQGSGGGGTADALTVAVQMARQAIFDAQLQVYAYELLFRSEGAQTASITDATRATAQVIAGATLDIGFRALVGDLPAFVNFPAEMIATDLKLPLGPDRIVIEVLEGAKPNADLLRGLQRLRDAGYRIALDDFDLRRDSPVLLDYADIVKVDLREHTPAQVAECVEQFRPWGLQLVAEKVETLAELEHCRGLGFDYFQGYFLQRPETFAERRVPSARLTALKLLVSLADPQVSAGQVETGICGDVGFSYRVLRCINSSYFNLPREVTSIRQAISLLGFEELRRICALVMLSEVDDRPAYVCVHAMVRARMCESLCVLGGLNGMETFFMTGLLSMLDVLLGLPMIDAVRTLPLSASVRGALLDHAGPLGAAVWCSQCYERGAWDAAQFMSLSASQIGTAYAGAVGWADGAWRGAATGA
jgi:EAL and modified HD-GYP domain-containing signal transduction protein